MLETLFAVSFMTFMALTAVVHLFGLNADNIGDKASYILISVVVVAGLTMAATFGLQYGW